MISTVFVYLSSNNPAKPLSPVAVMKDSAATITIVGANARCTSVKVKATNAVGTSQTYTATRDSQGWIVTIPASHFANAGAASKGFQVWGYGNDETSTAREWGLGEGDLEVLPTDGTTARVGDYTAVKVQSGTPGDPLPEELRKISGVWKIYHNGAWEAFGGGTGTVTSVNNIEPVDGNVTLTAENVGAPTAAELTSHTGATNNPHGVTAAQVGAYVKPNGGIPATDMAAAVQTALTAATNAAPQATTYTKTEVDGALNGKVAATNGTATNLVMVANDVSAVRVAFAHGSIEYSYDGWETIGNLCLPFPADLPQDCDIACMGNLPYSLSTTATAPTTRTVITKVLAAGATSDSYTLPAIDGEANTVQNCDIVVDARACTGDSIALTLTPTGTDIILYPDGTAPTLKKGTVTVIDCTSVKLGDDLVWLVMGATEMKTAS